ADGRGGQYLRVYPELGLLIVMTGGGCTIDDALPQIAAAVTNDWRALLPNPAGEAKLADAVTEVGRPPRPEPVRPVPPAAMGASGKTYVFENNAVSVTSLRFDFTSSNEAVMTLGTADEQAPRVNRVGMDGIFRPSIAGRAAIARASWEDEAEATLQVEYSEGPGLNNFIVDVGFRGDRLDFEIRGSGLDEPVKLVGVAQ
ncbi:MAG TPA: hypothetical protein VJP78_10225, partial [Thermoleophilia bacterium]|nr:hypothetical protein [Thermoleophilia bacterium]